MAGDIPLGLEAVRLIELIGCDRTEGVIYLTRDEQRSHELARIVAAADPDLTVRVFRPWDCLPFDSASPSREAMGHRISLLRRLAGGERPVVVTSPEAVLQRLPPPDAVACFEIRRGELLNLDGLRAFCLAHGYVIDDRVDEPGEIALRGEVIDIFAAACSTPHRLEIEEGRITAIRCYDPITQRSLDEAETLVVDPVSELPDGETEEPRPGAEHRLPEAYPKLATLFDYLPRAALVEAPGTVRLRQRLRAQIEEAHRDRARNGEGAAGAERTLDPDRLYLDDASWRAAVGERTVHRLEPGGWEPVPRFAAEPRPRAALLRFAEAARDRGAKVAIAAGSRSELSRFLRRARLPGALLPDQVGTWGEALASEAPVVAVPVPLDRGFVVQGARIAVIAAADLLGSGGSAEGGGSASTGALWQVEASELHLGDTVVHFDHGLAALRGIEALGSDEAGEAIRLEYAESQILLTPTAEAGKLWRYGSEETEVTLDRLNTGAWAKRRAKIAAGLAETARSLVAATAERERQTAPKLQPQQARYERVVARFPHPLTPDQARAVEAVIDDLKAGRPMNRLVVGDVGFGKTEVAIRAAAVAAFGGMQVAVVAPTTVLARQHYETFRRRFADLDIAVGHLSRLVPAGEARRVREGIADGSVDIAIGTHALLGKGVSFERLGLLIVDEEQRFGAEHKRKLRTLGADLHMLTMTATPIPRTLQGALVGLQDISAITTPPMRRRPIRTLVAQFDPASLRQALLRERRRGGQSFVVVPRVEDVAPLAEQLRELLPRLDLKVAHGQMRPQEVDEAMVSFASGRGDVLLATSIIESGLDVPRANTMVLLKPDLFGLAQLHQLRGRVGRGHAQAYCYLMSEPGRELSEAAERRLGTLQALDRLGAGMAISMHDLDLRGAGDLFGERQAGHVKLIGLGLYQELLAAAIRVARGEPERPQELELQAELGGFIPEDYVPEPVVRINLYQRLARTGEAGEVARLGGEIADRFGPPPPPVEGLLRIAGIRALAQSLRITRISAGPQGIALSFDPGVDVGSEFADLVASRNGALEWNGERLLQRRTTEDEEDLAEAVIGLLRELA